LRVIDEPSFRLTSADLVDCGYHEPSEVFDFARDYLGLLKAAGKSLPAWCLPGCEGSGQDLAELLATIVGPGKDSSWSVA